MAGDKILVSVDSENRTKDVAALEQALSTENLSTLQSIGHSLKGVGGGYGFHGLSEIGAAIETAAKSGDSAAVKKQVQALADYLARVEVSYE